MTEVRTPSNIPAAAESKAVSKKKEFNALDCLQSASFRKQLEMALPKHVGSDRFLRSAISDFRLNPELQKCSVPSVLGFYMQAAMCGLEPSSVLGQCYPVPFNNFKTGTKECQFIIGYRGMISLARRSGELSSIEAHVVHENDELFEITYGLESDLKHKPCVKGDAGKVTGAYCVVHFKSGEVQCEYMNISEINAIRGRSKAGSKSPWNTDFEEMCKKTVIRRIFKMLPISIEAAQAAAADENVSKISSTVDAKDRDELEDAIEIEFVAAMPEEQE